MKKWTKMESMDWLVNATENLWASDWHTEYWAIMEQLLAEKMGLA